MDNHELDILFFPLKQTIYTAQALLKAFLLNPDFSSQMRLAFGNDVDLAEAEFIVCEMAKKNSRFLPEIEIRSAKEINGTSRAFANATDTIYLSHEFLSQNAENIEAITRVVLEERNYASMTATLANDDNAFQSIVGSNPAFDLIELDLLHSDPDFAEIDGSNIGVAVIDTGIDFTHNLLSDNVRQIIDFLRPENDPQFGQDENGHGTHVGGTIAAIDPNIGIATDATLIGLKVGGLDGSKSVFTNAVEAALQWVLNNRQEFNIHVVNLSLGGGFFSNPSDFSLVGHPYLDDVEALIEAGVTVVSAAGNDYDVYLQPGSSAPGVFSTLNVGAVYDENEGQRVDQQTGFGDFATASDRHAYFSHRPNTDNTIFAPGAYITSTIPGSSIGNQAGTSQASPHVAGVVALMQEAAFNFGGRYLTPTEVQDIIISSADAIFDGDDENTTVPVTNASYPRLNAYEALKTVRGLFGSGDGNVIDPNGTIAAPFIVSPALDGSEPLLFSGVIGTDGSVSVGDKDVDIFRFEMAVPATLTVETFSNSGNETDTILRLFDENGRQLAINDDKADENLFSAITVDLPSGVYFAGVSGYDNSNYDPNASGSGVSGATGDYQISFALTDGDPNGLLGGAVRLNVNLEPEIRSGIIGSDDAQFNEATGTFEGGMPVGTTDVDLFEVVIPDNGELFIDIDTPSDLDPLFPDTSYLDSLLRVFDENGNELAYSDDDLALDEFEIGGNETNGADDNHGHVTDSYIVSGVQRGQRLFIGVSDWLNSTYNPETTANRDASGDGGYYQLFVEFQNNDLNGAIPQATNDWLLPIDDGPQLCSGVIGIDGTLDNEVGDRDVDFSQIRSSTGGIVEVDIDSTFVEPNDELFQQFPDLLDRLQQDPVDAVLQLWDAEGNLLATIDDVNELDPILQFRIAPDTDYFISTSGFGNDGFDPFQSGSGTPGDTGWYGLKARLRPEEDSQFLSNDRISNEAVAQLNVGDLIQDNIGFDDGFFIGANDVDIYEFQLQQRQRIEIGTFATGNFSADTFLRLFNADGNEIAFNDDVNSGTTDSLIQAELDPSTYYIAINGYSEQARNYDPITGEGVAPALSTSLGDYGLSFLIT